VYELFSKLLAPIAPEAFLKLYWGQKYLHIENSAPERFTDILSLADIDRFLQSEQLPAAFINVVSNGVKEPVEDWSGMAEAARGEVRVAIPERLLALYRNGATLILNQAHHSLSGVAHACRTLASELRFPVRANIYITPPESQGFASHSDDHELLILLIAGSKEFLLSPQSGEAVRIRLAAGDLLYIPRGLAHEARSGSELSVHVSLGLNPIYGFHLIEELAAVARDDPRFQQMAADLSREEFLQKLEELLANNPLEQLTGRRFQSLVEHQARGWPGRFTDLLQINQMTPETVLKARSGILTSREDDGECVRIHFASTWINVPKFLEGSLAQILSGKPFAIREIQGLMSVGGKAGFVKPFVEAGLLEFVKL
jgi:ribosomal protein L16 Arg81 hydroxylase